MTKNTDMTPAELFLELLKPNGHPTRQLKQYEALYVLFENPLDGWLREGLAPGCTVVNRWGVTMIFPENAPGPTPHITPENKACPDITHWRDYVHAPDIVGHCSQGWESVRQAADQARAKGKLATMLMGTGIFEQCHFLMGFEDTLTNLYEHPEEMHELIDYILEYRMTYAKILIDQVHPDVILSHDDWGTKNALFMKADMWREFFKEPYRKFYDYIRSQGVIVIHHADSYLVPIVEDMVEIGVQVWQGVLPENNIPALQEQLQGRMVLMGGVGAAIDRADSEEEEIRSYVREVLNTCSPRGGFIPCITYGAPGTVYPHVDPIINSEIAAYNEVYHAPNYRPVTPVRRNLSAAPAAAVSAQEGSQESGSTLERIAQALQKGQKNRVLSLCRQALEEGTDAQTILSDGLVEGMTQLGDDFTAGRVFVPEMLLAARCMTAATEELKAKLVGEASASVGRVCLGTVKGDMHDIGKNLVKIMMEGSGLEVIDLGVDVSAETFVRTAVEEHCNIIACSALLTTTMNEMRRVVELAKETGIRDQVKIMVGGAPISQDYCDEIGADLYTVDAASAAKAAVNALK
jgi:methanogenic corrinoid protein MtbC1/uroporphyrinogen-III decarboxylase